MYDIKSVRESREKNNAVRADCICDRPYFGELKYNCIFELRSMYIPTEGIIKK